MADRIRKAPKPHEQREPGNVLVRGIPAEVLDELDAWVTNRREELASTATDAASRRVASTFSRNDLVLDILAGAVRSRSKEPKP